RITPSGGVSLPNRRISALLNGRSHAKPLPRTYHVRLAWRSPSVTSGNPKAISAASSRLTMGVNGNAAVRLPDGWAFRERALRLGEHQQGSVDLQFEQRVLLERGPRDEVLAFCP